MKPLRETKLGQWLKEKAPKVLDVVGDVLPDKGILGIVKNLINSDTEIPAEQKLEFEKMLMDHEREMFALETADRNSARLRETEFVKSTGHIDWMHTIVGLISLLIFAVSFAVISFVEIPKANEHIYINAFGILEGIVLSVVTYYFGSSAGSRIKDMKNK